MKKVWSIENLDCANCAAKIEREIAGLNGVESVRVNFLTQKVVLNADESQLNEIWEQACKICRKIDPGCTLAGTVS